MNKPGNDDDNELFRSQMADVTPLRVEARVTPRKKHHSPRPRKADTSHTRPDHSGPYIEQAYTSPVAPEARLLFSRASLQPRQLQRLKRGDQAIEARLDLHGHTIVEAGAILHAFLGDAVDAGIRCVLIIHGKGQRTDSGKSVLKSQLNSWLRDTDSVLAFVTAQARHGGAGAVYVLLKRSQPD